MTKSIVELAQEVESLDHARDSYLADYQHKRDQASAELQQRLGEGAPVSTPLNGTVPKASTGKRGPKKKTESDGTGSKREGPTTKEHILTFLRRSRNGADLRGIVAEMTRLKQAGEWKTDSDDITSVVSQAMNGMKKKKMVKVERSPETNRNVYTNNVA